LLASKVGIDAGGRIVRSDEPAGALAEAASGSDLLVVASHGGGRVAGMLLGSVAAADVHRAAVPVLAARLLPKGIRFPDRILVASDGSPDAERGVELASWIARSRGSRIYFLAAGLRALPHAEQLGRQAAALAPERGLDPTLLLKRGEPQDEIPRAAREERASLVVIGSRGLSGVRALGSVSERVAAQAPCSVLVARPRPGETGHKEDQ
jgi:nucleotide-binding universal stress UspA family protein